MASATLYRIDHKGGAWKRADETPGNVMVKGRKGEKAMERTFT